MVRSSAVNLDITPNADGYTIGGGTTERNLTITSGNITLTGGGSNTYSMPAFSDTLVGRSSTDTLINKTINDSSDIIGPPSLNNSNWDWISWTPTWTNLTVGNGTLNYANYVQIGKNVFMRLMFTWGSTTSASGNIIFSVPVNFSSVYTSVDQPLISSTLVRDNSSGQPYRGQLRWFSATQAYIGSYGVSNVSFLTVISVTNTSPFTWSTGDTYTIEAVYEGV